MTKNTLESPPGMARMGGFSLVEALISFVIIAVGMLGLAKFQSDSLESNADSKTRTEALNLAQDKLEELRSLRDEVAFQAMAPGDSTGSDEPEGNHASFARAWNISRNTTPDNAVVEVTVSWTDPAGITQSVNLSSFIAEVSPQKTGQYYVAMVGVPGTAPTPLAEATQSDDN